MDNISKRKQDHVRICLQEFVESKNSTTYMEEVELIHQSLPELSFEEIETQQEILGKKLDAPLLISGMTGGADDVGTFNRGLAGIAQELNIAFGLGSQRAMLEHPELAHSYRVRDTAPDILLIANLGAVQLRDSSIHQVQELVDAVGANALAVHLNPAQELMQPHGDRDFRHLINALESAVTSLNTPIIVKETGAGLSKETIALLKSIGIEWIDTAGKGGTSWTGVEALRNPTYNKTSKDIFWDWGIPTAASIYYGKAAGMNVIGSGGIRHGLDVAKVIALGGKLAGMALPWLKNFEQHGHDGAIEFGREIIHTLKIAMCLTGAKNLTELQQSPRMIGPNLAKWLN